MLMLTFSILYRLHCIVDLIIGLVKSIDMLFHGALDDKCLFAIFTFVMFSMHRLLVVHICPTLVKHCIAQCAINDRRIDEVHCFSVILISLPVAVRLAAVINIAYVSVKQIIVRSIKVIIGISNVEITIV